MITRDIINILEKKFPKINAEEWDNVGLLVGDYDKEVKKIQFSIDASLEVIENAIKEKVDMIITHHPFIFKAIKSINEQDILSKKIRALIRNDINIYSIHTNLDSSVSGLNDYVLEKLGYTDYKFLDYDEEKNCGIGRIFKLDEEKDLAFAYSQLGWCYRLLGDYEKALGYLIQSQEEGRNDAWINFEIAINSYQ